jgi:hypothetical protein
MSKITTSVGSPGTVSSASGGRTYAFNAITTSPQQVIGANPQRQRITVHNPGTQDVFFFSEVVLVNGSDTALVPSLSALGGCYRVYANGGTLVIEGECQKSWGAFAASGSTNPLTVTDSNV